VTAPDAIAEYLLKHAAFEDIEEELKLAETRYEAAIEARRTAFLAVCRLEACSVCKAPEKRLCVFDTKGLGTKPVPSLYRVHIPRENRAYDRLRALGVKL
jgi:hypothetical protein